MNNTVRIIWFFLENQSAHDSTPLPEDDPLSSTTPVTDAPPSETFAVSPAHVVERG